MRLAAFAALVLAPSATVARADVLVVAPAGAPFTTIQAAVDAAVDGDTILVRVGDYPGFTVAAKSVAIVADPTQGARLLTPVSVRDLAVGQEVTVAGFDVPATFGGGLRAIANVGAVRFVAIRGVFPATAQDTWPTIVSVTGCDDVAVLRCVLPGWASIGLFPSHPGAGLTIDGSRVAVHDSVLSGGTGSDGRYVGFGGNSVPPLAGAPGCEVLGASEVVLSGVTATGGTGGAGLPGICPFGPPGGNGGQGAAGGPALFVEPGALVRVQDSVLTGGPGGNGGLPDVLCGGVPGAPGATGPASLGTLTPLAGPSRRLRTATHVREQNALAVELLALPGDRAFLQVGVDTRWTWTPALGGVRLVGDASRRAFLGVVPPSGTLVVQLPIADLGPGVESVWNHLQAFFIDSTNAIHLGGAQDVVLLDSAF